jgi:hypothetical protein
MSRIDGISDKSPLDSVARIHGSSRPVSPETESLHADDDPVELSDFGKVLSQRMKDLGPDLGPRPEKVAEFKDRLDDPVNLSDNTVATILKRMAGE